MADNIVKISPRKDQVKMAQLNIEKYQCANCCGKHINPSISSEECRLLDDLDKVFGNGKCIKSSFDGLNLSMCEFCNSAFDKLSVSRNEFFGRTGTSSWINRIVNSSEQYAISHISEEDNNQIPSSEIQAEESERILPSPMIIETQNSNPYIDENIEVENIEYEEKCLKLIIKKVVGLNFPYVPFSLRNHFSCPHCERKFNTRELIECHIKSVHQMPNTQSFSCQLCNKIFVHKWFYTNHLKVIHSGIELEFTCTICGENYKNKNDFNLHTKLVHSKLPFTCNHCEASFGTIGTINGIHPLRNHLLEFHSDSWEAKAAKFNAEQEKQEGNNPQISFQCPSCRVTFENRRILNCHVLFEHHNRNVCEVCEEEFSSSMEMSTHFDKTGHSLKTCNKCPTSKMLSGMHMLVRHLDSKHTTEQQNNTFSLNCEICGGGYRTYFYLLEHYKRHIRIAEKVACDQCNRSFVYRYELNRHLKTVHDKESSDKNNSSSQNLTSTSSFKCKICNVIFDSKKKLLLHCRSTISHGKPMQNNDSHRMKRHFTQEELQYVFLNHDEPLRKYECKVCKKGFRDSNKCFRHLCNLHSIYFRGFRFEDSRKKVECQECPICAKTVQRFSQHMLRHTKTATSPSSKSMKCNLCSYVVFGDILLMREHWIKCHPETTEAKSASNNYQRRKEELYSQTEKVYGKENKCWTCKLLFTSIFEKDKHIEKFHKFIVSCNFCGSTFRAESACRKHEKESHNLYPCKHCSTVSVTVEDFHNHFTEEHLQLPYICELCGQYFNKPILFEHYATHFGISQKPNPQVGHQSGLSKERKSQKGSKSVSTVSKPKLRHRRSKCQLCGERFPGKRTALLEDHHAKTHKFFASLECEACGHLFFELSSLASHMKIVHKIQDYKPDISKYLDKNDTLKAKRYSVADKKYKCPHCGSLFLKSESYNRHISKQHPGNSNSSNITAKSKSKTLPKRKCTKRKWNKYDSDSTNSNQDTDTSLSLSDSD